MAAMTDLKNQLAEMSLIVASRILERELDNPKEQDKYIRQQLDRMHFN
jgi:hypothetical protein